MSAKEDKMFAQEDEMSSKEDKMFAKEDKNVCIKTIYIAGKGADEKSFNLPKIESEITKQNLVANVTGGVVEITHKGYGLFKKHVYNNEPQGEAFFYCLVMRTLNGSVGDK